MAPRMILPVFVICVAYVWMAYAFLDIPLRVGENMTNPSVIFFNDRFYMATRSLTFEKKVIAPQPLMKWWLSYANLCNLDNQQWKATECQKFDPWKGNYKECFVPPFKDMEEGEGIEDLKLFHWPGKGMYGIFGRKPTQPRDTPFCPTSLVFNLYLIQIMPEQQVSAVRDPWALREPVMLKTRLVNPYSLRSIIADYTDRSKISETPLDLQREKNWMPFFYKDELYFVYQFNPMKILSVTPSGRCKLVYEHDIELPPFLEGQHVHGGPPVVYVPAELSNNGQPYYLGIIHHYVLVPNGQWPLKKYLHYLFKMEAEPPFKLISISREVPMKMEEENIKADRIYAKYVAYANGLQFVQSTDPVTNMTYGWMLLSYGSSDTVSRLIVMRTDEIEELFV